MRDRLGNLLVWAACGLLVPRPALAQAQEPLTSVVLNVPVLRYEIWVELDDAAKMLSGKEEIDRKSTRLNSSH
jgi:hypothetical protein